MLMAFIPLAHGAHQNCTVSTVPEVWFSRVRHLANAAKTRCDARNSLKPHRKIESAGAAP
jgi:hypothetical protein